MSTDKKTKREYYRQYYWRNREKILRYHLSRRRPSERAITCQMCGEQTAQTSSAQKTCLGCRAAFRRKWERGHYHKLMRDSEYRKFKCKQRCEQARRRKARDPEYKKRLQANQYEWLRKRKAADPAFRERFNKHARDYQRAWRSADPEYFRKNGRLYYHKMSADLEYRRRLNARAREYNRNRKRLDPEYAKRLFKQNRTAKLKGRMARAVVRELGLPLPWQKTRMAFAIVRKLGYSL
jgi:hypothetical protein